MSRQTAAVQTDDLDSVVINHELEDFTCIVTGQILFDPVMTHCGQHIERSASAKLQRCPCCNEENIKFNEPSAFFKTTLQKTIQQYRLYENVYFDLEGFKKIVAKNQLNTPIGERFLTLLQSSASHLNNKELIRTETQVTDPVYLEIPEVTVVETQGKSPIEILAETLAGRDLLRKKLKIESASGKYFFDNAEISAESLQLQVNGKSIREWVSMTTAMEKFEKDALERMSTISEEERIITIKKERLSNQFRLFLSRGAQVSAAASASRMHSEAIKPILQHVVYGEESRVKEALEAVKSNATLSALLSDTGIVKDYSDRTISGMTLLQAAAAAGDIEMCQMLKPYFDLIPNGQQEFANQLDELFQEGIEVHEIEQQRNTFNFDSILAAILVASSTDLDAALNKTGAQSTETDSARAKPDSALSLTEALNRFREQFAQHSRSEKIFNPQQLLRAFEVYCALWDQCQRDFSDLDYNKCDLFWRQIIGYTQRFMPACYAQAFSQGLYYLVKVDLDPDQSDTWRAEAFRRDLQLRGGDFSYFPLPPDSCSGLGFDFAISRKGLPIETCRHSIMAFAVRRLISKTYVEQKQQAFRTLCREFECDRRATDGLMNHGV